jgi:chaperone modulatory protein CbpM
MTAPLVEVGWLDAREMLTRSELSRACGLAEAELTELVDYGALRALPAAGAEPVFSAECLPALRRATRLARDLDLDLFTVALLLQYLDRIEVLERQVRSLRAQLSFHAPPAAPREGPQLWHEPHG